MHWASTYIHMECPHCKVHNVVNLGNLDNMNEVDVEACQCHVCSKKFWLPGEKDIHETNAGFGFDPSTEEELGLAWAGFDRTGSLQDRKTRRRIMGTIQIQTPLVVQAKDYHEFRHILDILNLSPHIYDSEGNRKPEVKLLETEKAPDGDYFWDGNYHAIIYIPDVDEEAAAKLAQEIEASLEEDY